MRTPVGSKDVRGVNGVRPMSQVRVLTLADWRSLGGAAPYGPENWSGVVLKVIQATLAKYAWVSARNTPPAG